MYDDQDDIEYHSKRAISELDRGLISQSMEAARAHLQLSSLHFERARELSGTHCSSRPPLSM
ncbi:hypothetical protein SH591_10890 [Sphingomonas sp. LY54]|uniref:hypothetical protein n=1 Tax=Sphingomonas sp. LY54 TaxID=3095343 RepID=UPI002D76FF94|nr:hypothetical protein [Sphingomonas sp. LY54]WRP27624.1 hypothetical protein SH591_10890 [Sphingomonas sp. LY54]